MKKFAYLFFVSVLLPLLYSCSPMRVNTAVVRQYPALNATDSVEVYYEDYMVPTDVETLGTTRVMEGKNTPSNRCDSITAISLLKSEVRKAGGNAIYVSEYTKPSSATGKCHTMAGSMLKVNDFTSLPDRIEEVYVPKTFYAEDIETSKGRALPRMALDVGAGYGWRTAKIGDVAYSLEDYYRKLMRGLALSGSFTYYFNDFSGISAVYSALTGNSDVDFFTIDHYGGSNRLTGKSLINYVGLDYAMRIRLAKDWIMDMRIGMGYIGYRISQEISNGNYIKEWGATLGARYLIGVDYRLTDELALTLNLSTHTGLVSTVQFDDNGNRYSITETNNESKVGLGQVRLGVGLRYYIN